MLGWGGASARDLNIQQKKTVRAMAILGPRGPSLDWRIQVCLVYPFTHILKSNAEQFTEIHEHNTKHVGNFKLTSTLDKISSVIFQEASQGK